MVSKQSFINSLKIFNNMPNNKTQENFIFNLKNIDMYILEKENKFLLYELKDLILLAVFLDNNSKKIKDSDYIYKLTRYDIVKHFILKKDLNIDGIIIEPDKDNIIIDRASIEAIDNLTTGMTLERTSIKNEYLELRKPKNIGTELKREIKFFAKKNENIDQINVYKARRNKSDKFHLLFFVKFKGRDFDLFPSLASTIQRKMKLGSKFELLKTNDKTEKYLNDGLVLYKKNNKFKI